MPSVSQPQTGSSTYLISVEQRSIITYYFDCLMVAGFLQNHADCVTVNNDYFCMSQKPLDNYPILAAQNLRFCAMANPRYLVPLLRTTSNVHGCTIKSLSNTSVFH